MAKREYITIRELNPNNYGLTEAQTTNLIKLHAALNEIREMCGIPFIITSGVRSEDDQKRIYMGKKKIPMGSAHLKAGAADVWDRDRRISRFCLDNLDVLKKLGLYIEDPLVTASWVHFQIIPPASGNRIFQP